MIDQTNKQQNKLVMQVIHAAGKYFCTVFVHEFLNDENTR